MLLAIDTATRTISIAVYTDQAVIAESTWQTANHHTVELTPALNDLLTRVGITPTDLTALAVCRGPGSYTGLRIGMSLAKGLALAAPTPLPVVTVPTLEVTAAGAPHLADRLIAIAQAGRRRINTAAYIWQDRTGWTADSKPEITTWSDIVERVDTKIQIAGEIDPDGWNLLAEHPDRFILTSPAAGLRRAAFLAELAYQRLSSGEIHSPAVAAPEYLT